MHLGCIPLLLMRLNEFDVSYVTYVIYVLQRE